METSPQTVVKPRYGFVDLAKGICIMLVVWHHVASTWGLESYPLKEAVSSFRMPLYFFLSGLFFKEYAGFFDFCLRKVNKLLVPFLFFYVTLSCVFPFILYWAHLRGNPGADVWYSFFWKQTFPNNPVCFILSLFWTNFLFYGMQAATKKLPPRYATKTLAVVSLALGVFGIALGRYGVKFPLFWMTSLSAMPYFCAGHLAFRYSKLLAPNRFDRWNVPVALFGFALVVALSWSAVPDSIGYVDNHFWRPVWDVYVCGLAGTLSVLLLSKALGRVPFVSFLGRYSIMVLVTHGWVQWGLVKALRENHVHWPQPVSLAFVFVVTLLLYLAIIPFMRKFLPHVTAQMDLIKR